MTLRAEARLLPYGYRCATTRAKMRQYLRHNYASSFYTIGPTPITPCFQCNMESRKEVMSQLTIEQMIFSHDDHIRD